MPDRTPVTVFISSPGDVAAERRRCVLVINRLNQEFGRFLEVRPYLWETEPMLAGGHFQDIIEPLPGDSDIVVVILWSRLGSPLPARTDKREYHGLDGRVPVTGTEWEVENALQAHAEKGRPDLLVYRNRTEARATGRDGKALRHAAEQLDALEGFWTRHFKDAETGGFKLGYNSYTSADQFEEKLETHLRARLKRLLPAEPAAPDGGGADAGLSWYQGSPFRGLCAFDVEHAAIFFGRWQARTQVIDTLSAQAERGRAFALVLGASGSGKSSLVRAGVLPLLERPGVTSGISVWRRCILMPGAHGTADDGDVFDRLAWALLERREALPEIATDYTAERLAARLREGGGGDILERALRQVANGERLPTRPDGPPPARLVLVLVIDQLEEIFTDARAFPAEAVERFARLLLALADSGVVWVIATLRSDFFHRLAEVPALLALSAGDGLITLAPASGAELDQIIRLPAQAAGLTFEQDPETRAGLDTVLREAAGGPDALPLLEFTLDELYRRDVDEHGRSELTFESYEALGGLEGAIAGRAEAACAALGADRAKAVDGVLLALAGLEAGDGAEGADAATLRVVAGADLARTAERAAVVDALVAARLLVSDAGPLAQGESQGRTTVRLAHEALLRRWPRYTELLARERDFLKARGRVHAALGVWLDQNRDPARLLPDGIALAEAEDLLSRRREDLEAAAIAYIEASSKAARARRDRRLRRTRMVAAAMALLAVLSGVGAWFGFTGQREAERQAVIAEQRKDEAESALRTATRAANTLVVDLAQKFKDSSVPIAITRSILEEARKLQDTLSERFPDDAGLQRSKAVALNELGEMLAKQGSLSDAEAAYREGLDTQRTLAARDPENTVLQRGVSADLLGIGDVRLLAGDAAAALVAYEESLDISRALAARDPDKLEFQIDVWASLNRVGDVRSQQEEAAAALATYEEALEIARALVAGDPDNPLWQDNLSMNLDNVGNARLQEGDVAAARAAYQEGLEIRHALTERDPDNTRWQNLVANSLNRIGDVRLRAGDATAALAAFQESLEIIRSLAIKDPENMFWQNDVSVALSRIGNMQLRLNDPAAALVAYQESLDISLVLVDRDPDNSHWQRGLIVSHWKIGDWQADHGTAAEARDHYAEALQITEDLAAANRLAPTNAWFVDGLKRRIATLEEVTPPNDGGSKPGSRKRQ
ncbi:ATP-binding protein [Rhodospira trueperi]|uniref:Tetratricopeptide repeat-containing protein n=1 Tax=Rhodospira trueperi TaxID=69960 RepID=A0A1G7I0B3_9PROT|nr:ATP-binding protein [Rhodospira trueperi]SDF06172.1 Tetratricopeptide repeat-containing protein [Rhodospira trueperi]